MPLIATRGAASAQGFGEFAQTTAPVYIEDVFSTYLYTGNGSTQTITNGIDLSTKGGLVWSKCRSSDLGGNGIHTFIDTSRGVGYRISSDLTGAQVFNSNTITAFNTNGFSIGNSPINNTNAENFVSWTFREQPKFFDIVTYTGNRGAGSSPQTINHNLGSVPGCIIIKKLTDNSNWPTYHRSLPTPNNNAVLLNLTNAALGAGFWNNTAPTSTTFTVGSDGDVNETGKTYVAYLFAHNAGGFGLSGSDNVISCGSFTTDGSGNATVTLDWEPQFILTKRTDGSSSDADWNIFDVMRGIPVTGNRQVLKPNSINAESGVGFGIRVTSTGMTYDGGAASATYIYIAIRRGPMKTPTTGTSVYGPVLYTGNNASNRNIQTGFPIDWYMFRNGTDNATNTYSSSRLQGSGTYMFTNTTASQASIGTTYFNLAQQNGIVPSTTTADFNTSGVPYMLWGFRRAPGFFDVVCYTGNGASSQTVTHNLGVAPELYICKRRNGTSSWEVWSKTTGVDAVYTLALQSTGAGLINSAYNGYATSTTIEVGGQVASNTNTATYVAYLFATCAGVSKVGRYTGTGTTLQVNCGFTGGARFVLIKRTDNTGDWYVWDSARGIVAGNDPYLLLNSTDAEVTNTDYVDTYSAGFEISSTAPAAINANGGTYIFLAVA